MSIKLDEYQQAAANWREGAVFVAAAAGAGKSEILIQRITDLIGEGVPPERILTLMYNTAAADLFRKRLEKRIGALADRCTVRTFHSFALSLLKEWFGGDPEFQRMKLLMEGEAYGLARKTLTELGFRGNSRLYLAAADVLREKMLPFETEDNIPGIPVKVVKFARKWQEMKDKERRYDFADMLYLCAKVLQKNGDQLADYLDRYWHVQVDETQDLSRARWAVSSAFGWRAKSFMLVGDLRQSLYSWSGSDMGILREFYEGTPAHPPAKLLVLPFNRRSTHRVVNLGNAIARPYEWHMGGDAKALDSAPVGKHPEVWTHGNPLREADAIVAYAQKLQIEKHQAAVDNPEATISNKDRRAPLAVLCRTNAWGILIEQRLMAAGIPVTTRGNNSGAWATNEGKDFLAYLQAVEGEAKADIARIANKPNRYLKKEIVEDIRLSCVSAEVEGKDRFDAFIRILENNPARGAKELAEVLVQARELPWEQRCIFIGKILLKDAKQREKEDIDALEVLIEEDDKGDMYTALAKAAAGFGSYDALQARGKKHLRPGVPAPTPVVEISTIHRYKGDEAPTVIVAGVCRDHMPHKKNRESEEEVRIWYVAVTRAKEKLIVSLGGPPSPFLAECGLAMEAQGTWLNAP